jgi:hypothetical protein
LLKKRIIKNDRAGSLPLFSEVFKHFFGEQHPIAKEAVSFEELIEGYFGRIDYETMKTAYDALSEIQKYIRKELETTPPAYMRSFAKEQAGVPPQQGRYSMWRTRSLFSVPWRPG